MKALFYPTFDSLVVRDLPEPVAASGEVLLEVAACGLCGSELETFKNRSPRRMPPLVMGHEFCGTVLAVGEGIDPVLVGTRQVANAVVSCGKCARCRRNDTHLCAERQIFGMHRSGAFAERVAVPARVLIPWPENLPASSACLAEPLANGVHIVGLTRHLPAETVLVIGAGPIGLMCQQAFRVLRGSRILACDLSEGRLTVSARIGAEKTVCSRSSDVREEILRWTGGEGVDVVVDAAGSTATKLLSLACLRPGGVAVWIGLHADEMTLKSYELILPEKQVLGTYGAKQEELAEALDLMRRGKVDVSSWVEVAPLAEAIPVFHRMLRPGETDFKAVFTP